MQAYRDQVPEEALFRLWFQFKHLDWNWLVSQIKVRSRSGFPTEHKEVFISQNQSRSWVLGFIQKWQTEPFVLHNVKLLGKLRVNLVSMASNDVNFVGLLVKSATYISSSCLHWLHLNYFNLPRIAVLKLVLHDPICDFKTWPCFFLASNDKQWEIIRDDKAELKDIEIKLEFSPTILEATNAKATSFKHRSPHQKVRNLKTVLTSTDRLLVVSLPLVIDPVGKLTWL